MLNMSISPPQIIHCGCRPNGSRWTCWCWMRSAWWWTLTRRASRRCLNVSVRAWFVVIKRSSSSALMWFLIDPWFLPQAFRALKSASGTLTLWEEAFTAGRRTCAAAGRSSPTFSSRPETLLNLSDLNKHGCCRKDSSEAHRAHRTRVSTSFSKTAFSIVTTSYIMLFNHMWVFFTLHVMCQVLICKLRYFCSQLFLRNVNNAYAF